MKIYTKQGDKGETRLLGGDRVRKDHLRIEAYGTVDELNSIIGMCRAQNQNSKVSDILREIQQSLFILSADLAAPYNKKNSFVKRISRRDVKNLERLIDRIDLQLKPLRNFILPGGSLAAAILHFARSVCRRAERRVVSLSSIEKINEQTLVFLNRLSDFLFVLARWVNYLCNEEEEKWVL